MSTYTDASLIMFPSGYKEDKIYSLKPTDGSGDLTFTRASTATRVNSDGLIETSPVNLLQYSEEFNNAAWGILNSASVSANTTIAPNGTTTADTLTFSANASSSIYQAITTVSELTFSVYAKVASGTKNFRLRFDRPSPIESVNFTATTTWQRFTFTASTTGSGNVYIINDDAGTAGSMFIWGAQLNIGSTAKPYFPTTDRLNVPRIDYTGGGCGKLLLEPQRTNLVIQSNDMTTWANGSGTMTKNATTSPDGTNNALSYSGTADCSTFLTASNGVYCWSLFVKQGTAPNILLDMSDGATGDVYTTWDFASKTFTGTTAGGSWTSPSTSYIECGDGWFRITLIATKNAGSDIGHKIKGTNSGYTYVYGAQVEAGSYVSSYIPTLASSVTRLADAAFKTGISSLIGQTEGVFYAEFTIPESQSASFFSISDNSSSNRIIFGYYVGELKYYANSSTGSFSMNGTIDASPTVGAVYKIAVAYKNNDFVVYKNGTNTNTLTTFTVPANLTAMDNQAGGSGQYIFASVKEILLFPTRLTNTQLASLTTL